MAPTSPIVIVSLKDRDGSAPRLSSRKEWGTTSLAERFISGMGVVCRQRFSVVPLPATHNSVYSVATFGEYRPILVDRGIHKGGPNYALDDLCHSADSVAVGIQLPCGRQLDPFAVGRSR